MADRYPEISIKNAERRRRVSDGVQKVHILSKDQSVPKQWKKYMSCGKNKESLIVFLCEYWSTYTSLRLCGIQSMYITSKDKCYLLTSGSSPNDRVLHHEVFELQVIMKKLIHVYFFIRSMQQNLMIPSLLKPRIRTCFCFVLPCAGRLAKIYS